MLFDMKYRDAVAKAGHLIALNDTVVHLRDPDDFPWDKATGVKAGGSIRLGGPAGCYIIAEDAGLTFTLNVDFELREANGRGASMFDRERLREVVRKLPEAARKSFVEFLADKVLPEMSKRTSEIRTALNTQVDSEDCVRGLIAYAAQNAN